MNRIQIILIVAFSYLLFAAPMAFAADGTCTPAVEWSDIPSGIRAQVVQTVGGEVSPRGGPFNASDVTGDNVPQSRFLGACLSAGQWTIAVERGGIGYHMQIIQFAGDVVARTWTALVPEGGFTPKALAPPSAR